jgi:peroxiredoxin
VTTAMPPSAIPLNALAVIGLTLAACLPHERPFDATEASKVGSRTEGYGLAVGQPAPDARVLDTAGRGVTLADVRGTRPAMLVFYRGGWCPTCNYQIHELSAHYVDFERRGVAIIAVSVDKPEYAAGTRREYGIAFALLSDPDLVAHRAYRVVDHVRGMTAFALARMGANLDVRSGRGHHDVAVPSLFVIDAGGIIRFAHADPDYTKRPTVAAILGAIDKLGVASSPPATTTRPTTQKP